MKTEEFQSVQFITISDEYNGQRVDNYLRTLLKGVPKSLIYRILRKGEVRINKKRVKPEYKLQGGDLLRLPPIRVSEEKPPVSTKLKNVSNLEENILFENDKLLVLNKPWGMAVHGGSGLSFGVIEALRALRPDARFLELVHRLDRDTSGCLVVAKKRSVLRNLHQQLQNKTVDKRYYALVMGQWPKSRHKVTAPLVKNVLASGERMVFTGDHGKPSETRFRILETFAEATLVEASPITGRTHQIRVHCQHAGHPIAGDPKYQDIEFNEKIHKEAGLDRLFLHAQSIRFIDPDSGDYCRFEAPLDSRLATTLEQLRRAV